MNTYYFFEMQAGLIPVRVIAFTEDQAREKVSQVYPGNEVKLLSITEYWMPAHFAIESMAKSMSKIAQCDHEKESA